MADMNLSSEAQSGILEAAKAVRALSKRSVELTPADVVFLCVDPVLSALGWNTRDPRQVRRADGATMHVEEGGKGFVIRTIAMSETIPSKLGETFGDTSWVVVTNGMTWSVFHVAHPQSAFLSGSLETTPTTRGAFEMFSMIRKGAMKAGDLNTAWSAESIDDEVADALKAHLAGSEELIASIRSKIAGGQATADAVKAAISRMNLSVNGDAVSAAQAADQAPTEAPKAAKAPKAAGKKPGRPAKATSAKTEKAPAKAKAGKKPTAATTATSTQTPEDPGWPEGATHVMRRKKVVAYIKYDRKTEKSVLLAGSIVNASIGKALNPKQIESRQQSVDDGSLEQSGDMMRVTVPMEFQNPRLAATFAAATLVKDISAWTAKNGRPIAGSKPAASAKSTPAATETPPAETDTQTEPAPAVIETPADITPDQTTTEAPAEQEVIPVE